MKPRVANGPWPRLQRHWDVRAACNFIGGGTGTGLLAFAAAGLMLGSPFLPAGLLALAFVGFGLTMVWLEIGKPLRALNVFFHPQTSWMTREGVVALPLFALGGLTILAPFVGFTTAALWAAAAAATCGIVFLYCQARILRAARGIPAWRATALTPFIMATGLTEGAGLYLGLALLIPADWAVVPAAMLLAVRAGTWLAYRKALVDKGVPVVAATALDKFQPMFLTLGHVVPAALLLAAWAVPDQAGASITLAGLLMTATGWRAKLVIVLKAATTQGFALARTPARGRGVSRAIEQRPGWTR